MNYINAVKHMVASGRVATRSAWNNSLDPYGIFVFYIPSYKLCHDKNPLSVIRPNQDVKIPGQFYYVSNSGDINVFNATQQDSDADDWVVYPSPTLDHSQDPKP